MHSSPIKEKCKQNQKIEEHQKLNNQTVKKVRNERLISSHSTVTLNIYIVKRK